MTVLVVVETVAVALLGLFVCGLLRSHAEILRALERAAPARPPRSRPGPTTASTGAVDVAVDLAGTAPSGERVRVRVRDRDHDTLLAFLSSGCSTCGGFWRSLRGGLPAAELPAGTHVVVVAKGDESLTRIRELAGGSIPVVLSSEAWEDYQVPVTPYFVLVDGRSGRVEGQGSATTWAQVASLLRQARGDARVASEADVDRELLAAGLHPGDPSLYPSRTPADGP